MTLAEFLDSQDFYELMQAYRHAPPLNPQGVCNAFDAVIAAILKIANENAQVSPAGHL